MQFYTLDFYGLKRQLPLSFISKNRRIANFNILGDVELTEKAGEILEQKLRDRNIIPDCFVGPEVKIVPFVHHMAKRFGHRRYVILRKSARGYMTSPIIATPQPHTPKHVKKLVLSSTDREFLQGKCVVLIDDVVSTGATMAFLTSLMTGIAVKVLIRCAIFKQGDEETPNLLFLAKLPLFDTERST